MCQMRTTLEREEERVRRSHFSTSTTTYTMGTHHMFFADPGHALEGRDVQRIHRDGRVVYRESARMV